MVNHIGCGAAEPGIYVGSCAEFCGLQHAQMRFRVVARAPADFAAWLAQHARSRGRRPTDPQAAAAAEVCS